MKTKLVFQVEQENKFVYSEFTFLVLNQEALPKRNKTPFCGHGLINFLLPLCSNNSKETHYLV